MIDTPAVPAETRPVIKCKSCRGSGKQKPPPWQPPIYGPGYLCMACNGTGNENWMELFVARLAATETPPVKP